MNNWLISPTVQIIDINGNPVVGGKVFVYDADTSNLSTIYSDESTPIANPVEIDELGNVTIWAELSKFYDIAVYDTGDNLLFAKKHICPGILSETNLDINAGDGCIVTKSGDTYTISVDFDTVATQAELVTKQDKLEAGRNIEITPANVINVTGRRAIVTQAPIQSNMSDNAWIVSFDSDAFIGAKGLMETTKLEYDPTSSRYVSYNGIPLGESSSPFTGVSANIPFTGNGTNESPLGLMPYISYGGNGITSTYSKSGLRVIDSNNNSAFYSASGINLNNASITNTDIAKWNAYSAAIDYVSGNITSPNIVYQTSSVTIPSGVWENGQTFNTNLFVGAGKKFTGTLMLKVLACNAPNFSVDTPGHNYFIDNGGDYVAHRINHHLWPVFVDNTTGTTPYEVWFKLYGDFPGSTTDTYLEGIEL